jgi:diadenosine tetraphosphate (Ap4A) HIT family hydrolase
METMVHRRVEEARKGTNPTVIARMDSGWAVLGDKQVVRGYSLLLPDPVVSGLNDLNPDARTRFLLDMALLGDALLEVTGAEHVNYEILGNWEPALHAHVAPRYAGESPERRRAPIWFYDWDEAPCFNLERDRRLMEEIGRAIKSRRHSAGGRP